MAQLSTDPVRLKTYTCITYALVQIVIFYIIYCMVTLKHQQHMAMDDTEHADASKLRSMDSTYTFLESASTIETILNRNTRQVSDHSCQTLFDYDPYKVIPVEWYNKTRSRVSNDHYRDMANDCATFKHSRGYLDSPFTEIEQNFPIAYSVIAYRDVEQIERLLRAIYRPQNFYCIHLDNKTSNNDKNTMESITSCFDNIFVAERHIDVMWGQYSVLEAELVCMRELYARKGWKYFINLTGQEFPLKTNLEIVKILLAMEGANIVGATLVRNFTHRWRMTKKPPHNIRLTKGPVHVVVNRDFVHFALHDKRSKDFLRYLKTTRVPDETFFSTLNHNPQFKIPGTFLGEAEEYPKKPTFTRYKNWNVNHGSWNRQCAGKFVRDICILGVGDLARIKDDIGLFANKLYMDFQPLAYDCLEQLIYNRTRDQYLKQIPIDVTYYSHLDQVHMQVKKKHHHDS